MLARLGQDPVEERLEDAEEVPNRYPEEGQPMVGETDAETQEEVLETIEAWGAEALLTGVAPLSEALVSDIETTHLLVRKDLPGQLAPGQRQAPMTERPGQLGPG